MKEMQKIRERLEAAKPPVGMGQGRERDRRRSVR